MSMPSPGPPSPSEPEVQPASESRSDRPAEVPGIGATGRTRSPRPRRTGTRAPAGPHRLDAGQPDPSRRQGAAGQPGRRPGPGRLVRRLGPLASLAPLAGRRAPPLEPIDAPSPPAAKEIRIVAGLDLDRLPSGYRTQAEDAGADRPRVRDRSAALIRQTPGAAGRRRHARDVARRGDDRHRRRFPGAGHDPLDGARPGDRDGARRRDQPSGPDPRGPRRRRRLAGLRPFDGHQPPARRVRGAHPGAGAVLPGRRLSVDLCLLDPAMPAGVLAGPLESHVAISLLAPAQAIENQAERDPEAMAAVRQAITEGWVDVAGGTYAEAEDLPFPARVDPLAVPQGAARSIGPTSRSGTSRPTPGAGSACTRNCRRSPSGSGSGSRSTWASTPGGSRSAPSRSGSGRARTDSSLETLLRPPLAADRPAQGMMIPWRLAATMRNDHVATLPLVHWPSAGRRRGISTSAGARRIPRCSPAGSRSTTTSTSTDRPYETFRPDPDSVRLALPRPGRGPARPRADLAAGAAPSPAGPVRGRFRGPCAGIGRRLVRRWRGFRIRGNRRRGHARGRRDLDRDRPACRGSRGARRARAPLGRPPCQEGRRGPAWGARRGPRRLPRAQSAGRAPARRGGPARRRARPPAGGPAPRRPVHRRGSLRRGGRAGVRLRLGAGRGQPRACRRPRRAGSRPAAARSRTSRSSSRSTRPPAGSAA